MPLPTFSQISVSLDKTLSEVKIKKDKFEAATLAAGNASNEYSEAIESARVLRNQLEQVISELLPVESGRIRVA